jgi:hypothetical protein
MESSVFWNVMPCSLVKVNWHFRGTYHLYLQDWRVSKARYQQEAGDKQSLLSWLLVNNMVHYFPEDMSS